jgi:hypothetical protein
MKSKKGKHYNIKVGDLFLFKSASTACAWLVIREVNNNFTFLSNRDYMLEFPFSFSYNMWKRIRLR